MAGSRFSLEAILSLTDHMTRPYRRTANRVNALSRRMKEGFKKVARAALKVAKVLAVAMVAAVSAVAVATVRMVNEVATAGDEIAKTSRQIGMGVEAFQELRFAADRQGVSSEDLTGSLQKLNKNVGDLRAGTGQLRTMLNNTNPALAEQLKNVTSNEEAFMLLSNEIGSLESPMDRAALAQAAFGRSGQEMLKLIEAGPEGLSALREEARSYGLMSEEAAAASEAYVDSLTNLKAVAKGLAITIASDLIPEFTGGMDAVKEFVMANRELITLKIREFLDTMRDIFNAIRPPIEALIKVVLGLAKHALPTVLGLVKALGNVVIFVLPLIESVVGFFQGLFQTLQQSGQLERLKETFSIMVERLKPLKDTLIDIIATVRKWLEESGALDVIVSIFRALGAVVGALGPVFQLVWRIAKPILNGIMMLLKPIFKLISAVIDGMTFVTQGIGGIIGRINDNRENNPMPETNFWGMPTRSAIEQQQAIVEQERQSEDNTQRHDLFLHSAIPGTAISQMGNAPSTAVSLGGQ